jgi:hypothetical protein
MPVKAGIISRKPERKHHMNAYRPFITIILMLALVSVAQAATLHTAPIQASSLACGVWEAVYILDGLLKNRSALQPDTLVFNCCLGCASGTM